MKAIFTAKHKKEYVNGKLEENYVSLSKGYASILIQFEDVSQVITKLQAILDAEKSNGNN